MPDIIFILIPIVLFFVTLIIMLLFRAQDKRDRKLEMIKRYVTQFQGEMKQTGDQLNQRAVDVEERIAAQARDAQGLLRHIDEQILTIRTRSEDLTELEKVMAYYHQVLEQLSQLTDKAEARISQVREDIRKIDQVNVIIDNFKAQAAEAQDMMNLHKQNLTELDERSLETIRLHANEEVETALSKINGASTSLIETVQSYLQQLDAQVDTTHDAAKILSEAGAATVAAVMVQLQEKNAELQLTEQELLSLSQMHESAREELNRLTAAREDAENAEKQYLEEQERSAREAEARRRILEEAAEIVESEQLSTTKTHEDVVQVVESESVTLDPIEDEELITDDFPLPDEEEPMEEDFELLGADDFDDFSHYDPEIEEPEEEDIISYEPEGDEEEILLEDDDDEWH